MHKARLESFLHQMSVAVLEAGRLAEEKHGKVENIGKQAEILSDDIEGQAARRNAKTVIDEQVQEIYSKLQQKF